MITVTGRHQFLKELSAFLPEKPKGVEIGVHRGDFSQIILDVLKPERLFLVDSFETVPDVTYGEALNNLPVSYSTSDDYLYVLNRFSKEIKLAKVVVFKSFSHYIVRHLKDELYDFVYVDASHLYADVKRDLNDWWPKLKKGAIISGHDYIRMDGFGVIEAVDEFKEKHGLELFLFNQNGGDWALRKTNGNTAKYLETIG